MLGLILGLSIGIPVFCSFFIAWGYFARELPIEEAFAMAFFWPLVVLYWIGRGWWK